MFVKASSRRGAAPRAYLQPPGAAPPRHGHVHGRCHGVAWTTRLGTRIVGAYYHCVVASSMGIGRLFKRVFLPVSAALTMVAVMLFILDEAGSTSQAPASLLRRVSHASILRVWGSPAVEAHNHSLHTGDATSLGSPWAWAVRVTDQLTFLRVAVWIYP